jgi:putative transcriptional regulator
MTRNRTILATLLLAALLLVPGPPGHAQDAEVDSLAGQFLVAEPSLDGTRFEHSVILMIEHDADGAFGLRINRPAGAVPWQALLDQLGLEGDARDGEVTLYSGGPVQPRSFFLLHGPDAEAAEARTVLEGVALTAGGDLVRRLAEGEGPAEARAILGYAGWAPGQLETELERGSWFTVPASAELVFDTDPESLWQALRDRQTIEL